VESVGQQYQTDTGPMDIPAVSKDKKTLLVVELKKGLASDVVIGQVLRYMGYVKEELAEEWQDLRGVVIALEDDMRIRRALSVVHTMDFFRYQISFKEQVRNNFGFVEDWAPEETAINRHVRMTSTAQARRPISPRRLDSSLGWFRKPEVIFGLILCR